MSQIRFNTQRDTLWPAARQEALRWQVYLRRVPLFLITASLLYWASVGLLRDTANQSVLQQILILVGYAALYWIAYLLGRMIQAWFRARTARRARFRDVHERETELSFADGILHLTEGRWEASVPTNRIYSVYWTKDYMFLDCPLLPWMPIARTSKTERFATLLTKRGKKQEAEKSSEAKAPEVIEHTEIVDAEASEVTVEVVGREEGQQADR